MDLTKSGMDVFWEMKVDKVRIGKKEEIPQNESFFVLLGNKKQQNMEALILKTHSSINSRKSKKRRIELFYLHVTVFPWGFWWNAKSI